MKKTFKKIVAGYLIVSLTLSLAPVGSAFADDWDDYDASLMPEPEPEPVYTPPPPVYRDPEPVYEEPVYTPPPATPSYTPPPAPAYTPPPAAPAYTAPADAFDEFNTPSASTPEPAFDQLGDFRATVDASSEGFIRVVRPPRREISEFQNAVIEGLQVSVSPSSTVEDEITVTGYFIFRDRPTSFFYDIDRKENKLIFEFMDARTGSSPIAALEQAPIREIVIDEAQVDANKSIKGLNPEWHDMIRISFQLDYLPVIAVSNEQNIISFSYKWTTNNEKIPEYLHKDKFPMVFWISGGTLGGIGVGVLTYFLTRKEKVVTNVLSIDDLPNRTR
ncbi:MAG: hypothetical protein FWC23_06995 [Chitinispirillia bacterium]|nr:hypothetical protein [Chitinispirillia bacterium]MCL2268915.1 hypothetical protein [Chitinispirillia bacterium]